MVDTGASVGLMDCKQRKEYALCEGRKYKGVLMGAGGKMKNVVHCDTFAEVHGKVIPQFLIADISDVVESIKRETNIPILGVISLDQMRMCGIGVDANDMEIIIE